MCFGHNKGLDCGQRLAQDLPPRKSDIFRVLVQSIHSKRLAQQQQHEEDDEERRELQGRLKRLAMWWVLEPDGNGLWFLSFVIMQVYEKHCEDGV